MNTSMSDPDLSATHTDKTPPNYVFNRNKRSLTDLYKSDFDNFKEDMKQMMITLLDKHQEKLQDIKVTLNEIREVNQNIENSVAFLKAQNEDFKKKIDTLENQAKEDRKCIILLEDKIEELQKSQRKSNFEIKNVPKIKNETKENLLEFVTCLAKNLGSNMSATDVNDIYRIRGKKMDTLNTSIIVETNSTLRKTEMLKLCKEFNIKHKSKLCAKHLGLRTSEDTPIFVSEHLTLRGSRLYFLARDLAKSKGFTFCWTAYGKVYVRKTATSPIINIINEAQIQQLLMAEN
ncbi:hypothetical protein PYW08_011298 [Mythimna loreyi]|uniref:Uncharacterized protein n=1 Tax=Mythimna loreyi TaxID=667449 RepID=A0ACC2Q315_9NEOP|nr:hypothetical protein PYW08_011298 [Mythimna loreyi]